MGLTPGQSLAFYEILAPLGAGGMGEVYRARDTRLEREVAIKVLPESLAGDEERLRRFEREAKTLASLNHPHVAGIHGVDQEGETYFLALELVPGQDLAQRLARGPLPLDEALDVCRQIAAGLEAAHEAGVVHRDLKPANVRITPEGVAKVLDFGLAKPLHPRAGEGGATTAESDSFLMTEEGMVLGTPTYMSPEQARGRPVDRRTDIWAFGCVLFECLTGERAFHGASVPDVLAAIVSQEPNWAALPANLPVGVLRLLRRCLEKDPRRRLRDVGEARVELEALLSGQTAEAEGSRGTDSPTVAAAPAWRRALPWVLVLVLLALLVERMRPRPSAPARPTRLEVRLTPGEDLSLAANQDGALAVISPDGRSLVYLAHNGSSRQLYLRRLDQLQATPLAGTENASSQFFSPDGASIAFFTNRQLMRVPLAGGAPTAIAPVTNARGGSWGPDNTIVFTGGVQEGLSRVPAQGGRPEPVTTLRARERTHRWPTILPDGEHVLFGCQASDGSYDDGTIEVASIADGERKVLVRGGTFPRYVDGHLLYCRRSTVYAVRFDVDALELRGEPQPVLSGLLSSGDVIGSSVGGTGAGQFSIADDGTAVYISGTSASMTTPLRLVVLDREGRTVYEHSEAMLFRDPCLSPDGERVAVRVDGLGSQLHLVDTRRGSLSQITFGSSGNAFPVWSHDGNSLAYVSDPTTDDATIWVMPSDGTGAARPLGKPRVGRNVQHDAREFIGTFPTSFSPDDSQLAVDVMGDVYLLSLADGGLTPLLDSPSPEAYAQISPDGKWLVFLVSDSTGIGDIYVRAHPSGAALRRVSTNGGTEPHWSLDGREIVYLDFTGAVTAVDATPEGDALAIGTPRKLFDTRVTWISTSLTFDVSADGSRFALLVDEAREASASQRDHVTVVFDFLEDVRQATAGPAR